jgi:predicted site-specific integrase-resolvase
MPDLMTEIEVAELLRLTRQTLSRWRQEDRGPPFIQVEGSIRYQRETVQRWLDERTLGGTLPT